MASLTNFKPGDIAHCRKLGVEFYGIVQAPPANRQLTVDPINPGVNYRTLKASEVIKRFKACKS